jgi:hypothetical protein
MYLKRYTAIFYISIAALIAALYFYGKTTLFVLAYIALFLFASFRALQSSSNRRTRLFLIIAYAAVMTLQIVFYVQVVAEYDSWIEAPVKKLASLVSMLLPMVISRYVAVSKYTELYLPTFQETVTISFSEVREFAGIVTHAVSSFKMNSRRLTPGNFKNIIDDLPRHGSFHYVNSGSLTDDYFHAAEKSLKDPNLYIVISNTGTPASEIISVFTQKQFNHASIAFDAELQTIISYNGGARAYRPGLNHEMVDFFNRRTGASILVYRLPVTIEQKRCALDKIAQINHEGSAYNLLGLLINKSYKPNIMYCSQFVYKMLEYIGASYFKADKTIKPTDLIEKDYFRKLVFVEELRLNKKN